MGHGPDIWRYLSPVKLTRLAFKGVDNGLFGARTAKLNIKYDSRVEWMTYRAYLYTVLYLNDKTN